MLLNETGAPNVVIGSGWSEHNAKLYFARKPLLAIQQIFATKTPLVVEATLAVSVMLSPLEPTAPALVVRVVVDPAWVTLNVPMMSDVA